MGCRSLRTGGRRWRNGRAHWRSATAAGAGRYGGRGGSGHRRSTRAGGERPSAKLIQSREYRIAGVKRLSAVEAGDAVYPFLGPERTAADVEQARAALEAAYREKGFQTVTVEVPEQTGRSGIIVLKAVENTVGRLRVQRVRVTSIWSGSSAACRRWLRVRCRISMKSPGRSSRSISGRTGRVTPSLQAGVEPGTVDIDLKVEDKLPLHGSVELNNRYSANTTPLRVSASANYGNLWQLGHGAGFSYLVGAGAAGRCRNLFRPITSCACRRWRVDAGLSGDETDQQHYFQ